MKNVVTAAGILTHVSPVLADKALKKPIAHQRDIQFSRFLERSHNKHKKHHRRSISRRVVTSSRAQSRSRRPLVGKRLKNDSPSTLGKTCDRLSHDADTGILSCGPGYECIVNQESSSQQQQLSGEGGKGGICVLSMRELQEQEQQGEACLLCDYGFTVGYEFYNVSVGIPLPGYDGTTCGKLIAAAYVNTTISADACPVVIEAVRSSGCCAPMCDLCGPESWTSDATLSNAVSVPQLEGYSDETCESIYNAAYYYATINTQSCSVVREAAMNSGCCVSSPCDVCGPEEHIADSYSSGTTCGDLRTTVYSVGNLTMEQCTWSTQVAQDEGCCETFPVYDCNVCGEGVDYPDNWIYKLGTCEYGQSILNETQCEAFSDLLVPWCCASSIGEPDSPTASPEEDNGEPSSPTSSPKSASVRRRWWSPSDPLVSLVCLVVATTGSAWWVLQ